MASDWITTTEAIELSGYHLVHLWRLLSAGKIKAQKWGHQWQVSRASLLDYMHQMEQLGEKRGPKNRD
jgi:excisionase family DNA binding protein